MSYVGGTAVPTEEDIQRALKRQKETRNIEVLFFNSEDAFPKVHATTEEVQAYFQKHVERYRYPKRMKIDYVEALPEDFIGQATPSEDNLLRWFNSNKEQFVVPVEREVAAITFAAKDFRGRVTFTEEDLKAFFQAEQASFQFPEKYRARFIPVSVEVPDASIEAVMAKTPDAYLSKGEAVAARHILLRTGPDSTPAEQEEVRKKVEAIRSRIKTVDDFIREAKENSDDLSNKSEGGDLGFFEKQSMVPEFEAAAFGIPEATVSQPIKTSYGYHLIWKYGHRNAGERISFKEARQRPTTKVDSKPLKDAAKAQLLQVKAALAGKSLKAATSVTGLAILETDWFARGDTPHPEISRDRYPFYQAISKLAPGVVSDVVEGNTKFYLTELIEKQEARNKTFEEARADVEKAYRARKAADFARAQAQEAASQVRSGSLEFSKVPQVYGVPAPVTHAHLRNPSGQQRDTNTRVDREILTQAFTLTQGKAAGPFDTLQGPTLLNLVKETPEHLPDLPEVDNEVREAYRKVVATQKARDQVWEVWIALEKYQDNLQKAAESFGVQTKKSDFFEPGTPVPGFPSGSVVSYVAAGLRVVGATTSVLEDPPSNTQNPQPIRAYYLIQAATIEESRLPKFDEVKAVVRKDLQLERATPISSASAEAVLGQLSDVLKSATAPLSASRSIDLGSFSKQRNLKLLGPLSVRLDTQVPSLPGQNSGGSITSTAYSLPLGGLSKVVKVSEPVREGETLAERVYGYAILQVVDIKATATGAASRGQAFRALASTLQEAVHEDWSDRGRKRAKVKANEDFVSKEAIEELTKESNKT
jgi:parvulin-like peptidyl-prolyl isomerase